MMPQLPAYPLLFGTWILAAIFWYWVALSQGKRFRAESDGCMLGFANVVLSLVGGGIGYLFAPYPWSLLTSLAGTIVLPGLITWLFVAKSKTTL